MGNKNRKRDYIHNKYRGVYKNSVCESNVGETKTNCPKDCSGGN